MVTCSRSALESIRARVKQLTVVPMPQPGHQMWGMRSMRRKGSTGLRISLVMPPPRWPAGCLPGDERRRRHGKPEAREPCRRPRAPLPAPSGQVQFGDHKRLDLLRQSADAMLGEGPGSDEAEFANTPALRTGQFDSALRYP